jgi:hypothetical protein
MLRTLLIISVLGFAAPVAADPNPQLVSSVQSRLNSLGLRDVDASTLSTRQIAALHLKLQGPRFGGVGLNNRWLNLRRDVQAILRWEEEGRRSF